MANVAEFSGDSEVAAAEPQSEKSRKNFLAVLRALGARVNLFPVPPRSATSSRRQRYIAFLSCELETWIEAFGEPQDVTEHYDCLTHFPFQAWQQPFADGTVTCVGHLFERYPGRRWVTVARVLL